MSVLLDTIYTRGILCRCLLSMKQSQITNRRDSCLIKTSVYNHIYHGYIFKTEAKMLRLKTVGSTYLAGGDTMVENVLQF